MPRWFIGLFVLSIVAFVCSWSGDLVLATSIWTFGLMLPVWFVAANLWWVLLAAMPALALRQRGKGAVGLVLGVGLLAASWIGASVLLGQSRAALTPVVPLPEPGMARAAGAPSSVEIVVLSEQPWDVSEETCGRVCQALLTGPELRWLRIQTAGPTKGETIVFQRADTSACLAFDPDFPATDPCLLARQDDGTPADLRIEITQEGDFWGPMERNHGAVYLTGVQRLILIDNRVTPPQVLDERLRYGWSEPVIGPLFPGMTALGSGAKSNGPGFKRVSGRSEAFDVVAVLAHAGLQPGPVDPPTNPQDRKPVLYSTALLASILATVEDGKLSPGQSQMARAFVDYVRRSSPETTAPAVGQAERKVLQLLATLRGDLDLERTLTSMMGEHPDYFVEDFGALLRVVVTGTPQEAQRAAKSASFGLFRSKRGDQDAVWPDYVAAIESGRSGELILWIGRFNQDPVPLLQRTLARTSQDQSAWAALSAICYIDQRWWPSLTPVVHDAAIRSVPSSGDTDFSGTGISSALRWLVYMERRDLADDVMDRIDWSLVQGMPDWADSPGSAERFRDTVLEGLGKAMGC